LLLEDSSSLSDLEITETLVIVKKKDFCSIKRKKNYSNARYNLVQEQGRKKERERERKNKSKRERERDKEIERNRKTEREKENERKERKR
jgi:hypothetical protein